MAKADSSERSTAMLMLRSGEDSAVEAAARKDPSH